MLTQRPSDLQLLATIRRFEAELEAWAIEEDLWLDCSFTSYADHVDGEPGTPAVISILCAGSTFALMLDSDIEGFDAFQSILERHGLWYEQALGPNLHFYLDDENIPLAQAFAEYARWQWICSLIQPDFADVSEELYQHFARRPEDLYNLHWRDFEVLLHRIFQARGFQSELGPGGNDGGVDIRLLQRDPIGDMLTLVQAKCYHPKNKIGLEAVQALHGASAVEQAPRSIFVTTSSYLPSARKFAARTSGALELCTSKDVVGWCQEATLGIIQDKSRLVQPGHVSRILTDIAGRRDVRVVHANVGVTMILNSFALVIKESEHAALLMRLPQHSVSHDGYGQVGMEVPTLDGSALADFGPDTVWRVKRKFERGRARYWDGSHLWSPWSGNPEHFSYLD